MSNSLDQLAAMNERDTMEKVNSLDGSIRQAITSGMPASEVVQNLNFPKSVQEPHQALISVALAAHYQITPERAYGMYGPLKEALYPDLNDEELVTKLFMAEKGTLPDSTVNEAHHRKVAEAAGKDFEQYQLERTEAEAGIDDDLRGLIQSKKSFEEWSKPILKQRARQHIDDEWFGKGNQHDQQKMKYYDALFDANDAEERQIATDKYINNLKVIQQYRLKDIKRLEYQIENNTQDESFWTRKRLAAQRGKARGKGMLAKMGEVIVQGLDWVPRTEAGRLYGEDKIKEFRTEMRQAYFQSTSPELWRPELNAWDGMTNALLENTPTMAAATVAAIIGGMAAGPTGAKMGVFFVVGAAESADIYPKAMENGFSVEEANVRSNIGFVINGLIEAAGGGITKYAPVSKKKVFGKLTKKGISLTKVVLKELMEELPQELTTTILTNDTPYKPDGTVDMDEVVNQILLLARDTAFMAGTYAGASKGMSSVHKAFTKTQVLTMDEYDVIGKYFEDLLKDGEKAKVEGKVTNDLTPKSPGQTEDLNTMKNSERFYIKKEGDNQYTLWDSDTGQQYAITGETVTEGNIENYVNIMDAKDQANLNQSKDNPMTQLYRFTVARVANGETNPVYVNITKMLDGKSTHQQRMDSAEHLAEYVTDLKKNLIESHFDQDFIDKAIKDDLIEKIHLIPDLWKKGREIVDKTGVKHLAFISPAEKLNAVNELRQVMRFAQIWGEGKEADMKRNYIYSLIKKVKPNKKHKDVLSEKDAKQNKLAWMWDMTLGTSKDDFITTLVHMFGNDHIPIAMKIINARTMATGFFEDMGHQLMQITVDLDITNQDKHDWSTALKGLTKPTLIDLSLGGENHQLTMSQIMFLNLSLRNSKHIKVIAEKGVAFPNYDIPPLSEEEMREVVRILEETPKAKAYVDAMEDFYIQVRGAIVNIGSQDMYGYDAVTADNFLPLNQKGQDGPMLLKDMFAQNTEDIRRAAHYTGIKPTTQLMESIIHSTEFKKSIQTAGKTKHLKRFQQEISAMEKSLHRASEELGKLITKIGANRARSILANGRIATLQAGSYQLYQNETDSRYMRGGHAPKEVYETWDLYRFRAEGMGSVHSVASNNTVRKMHLGKSSPLDFTMYPMHKVDLAVVRQAATIAWHEMTDKVLTGKARRWWKAMNINPHELKIMSPEFIQVLHNRADYLASTTQPMFFPESRNLYSNSDNVMFRELARFRSFTDQLLRNNARAMALWRMGEISSREAFTDIARNIIFSTVWYNGLKWVFRSLLISSLMGAEKSEKEEEAELYRLFLNIILGPISQIPFIGWTMKTGIQSLAEDSGYGPASFSSITAEQLSHTANSMYTLAKAMKHSLSDKKGSEEKAERLWKKGMRGAAEDTLILFFGLPPWLVDIVPEEKPKKKKSKYSIY